MQLSKAGQQLSSHSGIVQLMEDLGKAMTVHPNMRMLGGGNPAQVPQMVAEWRNQLQQLLDHGDDVDRMLGNYDPPQGNPRFLHSLADYLRRNCQWDVTEANLTVIPGGQTAFFLLFNMLAGEREDGSLSKIMLPLIPEYIGYRDQCLAEDAFVTVRPKIELQDAHRFKYRIDLPTLECRMDDSIAAICFSRPTNPSGNVLTSDEVERLQSIASARDIPLIVDNAYGNPFPGAIFADRADLVWNDGLIFSLSLSKLGLPGTRTGIVVAKPEITRALTQAMAIMGLANGNVGQRLVTPLLEDNRLDDLVRSYIRPFYANKSERAEAVIRQAFGDQFDYHIHVSEGAFFLWLWFPKLKCTSLELYQRLKDRDVLVVPGEYFFFGEGAVEQDGDWSHQRQCVRLTFSQNDQIVKEAVEIIADEVKKMSDE